MTIDVFVNGAKRGIPRESTVAVLLGTLESPARGIAVAVNREVVPKTRWSERILEPGDRIDIVRAIGGG